MVECEKVANYIAFAESLGIQVLPPNINESYSKFTVKGDKIIFGLAAIKNVGYNVVEGIVEARSKKGNFESLIDFINKIDLSTINTSGYKHFAFSFVVEIVSRSFFGITYKDALIRFGFELIWL